MAPAGDGLGLFFPLNRTPCDTPFYTLPPEIGPRVAPRVIGFRGRIAPNNTTTSMNIVVPTGTVDGDLLVWICGDTASAGIISNTPSGWVAPPGSKGTSGGGAALAVYTRIASGDAGATYTGSGTIYPAFIIVTVRGVGPTGSASFDGIAFATDNSNIIYTPALSGLSPQLI